MQPPFRAEHIGSLLRPRALLDRRGQFSAGKIGRATLAEAENDAIAEAVALQQRIGFNLATDSAQSAIIAVLLPDQQTTVLMWQALLEAGLYVNMARPPATPAGTFLLRCSLCAEHSDEEVGRILEMFEGAGKAVGVI